MNSALICRGVRIHGRVQGVGFRWATVDYARQQGVSGWARNRIDGSVEVLVWGDTDAVIRVLDWLRHGPSTAQVERIEVEACEVPDEALDGFHQTQTI